MPSVEDTESEEERQIQEALRLSLLEEEQRKKRLAEETDNDMQDDWELKEAIRLSLELDKQNQGSTYLYVCVIYIYICMYVCMMSDFCSALCKKVKILLT